MPEQFGGKKLADNFRSMLENTIQKAMIESQGIIQEAANELAQEMKGQAKGAAKMLREETRHVRETFGAYTGNNPEGDGTDEKQTIKPEDVGKVEDTMDGKPDPTTSNGTGGSA